MDTLSVRNLNGGYHHAVNLLLRNGQKITAKEIQADWPWAHYEPEAPVLRLTTPLIVEYARPTERPILSLNPVALFMNALGNLGGHTHTEWFGQFAPEIEERSDNEATLYGMPGARLRGHWRMDQIDVAADLLSKRPDTSHVVLSLWDVAFDLTCRTSNRPRITSLALRIMEGALTMLVTTRGGHVDDVFADDAVFCTMVQELVASLIRVPVGSATFAHGPGVFMGQRGWPERLSGAQVHHPMALASNPGVFLSEVQTFIREAPHYNGKVPEFTNLLLGGTAYPMYKAWQAVDNGQAELAKEYVSGITASDWRNACEAWLKAMDWAPI